MTSRWVFHPFLFALFPALFLYAHNMEQTSSAEVVMPSAVVFGLTLLAWSALWWVLKSPHKAGLIVSLFLVLFFSSEHIHELANQMLTALSEYWVPREVNVWPRTLVLSECVVFAALSALIIGKIKNPLPFTAALNTFAIVLVLLPTASVVFAQRRAEVSTEAQTPPPPEQKATAIKTLRFVPRKPDIYYIILDGYARSDLMKSLYAFDNGPFLSRLKTHGFVVAQQSHANYCQTPLCIASALNCQYLDASATDSETIQAAIKDLIGNNAIVKALKAHGYQFISFATGFDQTDHPEVDLYLSPNPPLSEFQWMLVSTTPLAAVLTRPSEINPYKLSRKRTLYLLDKLPEIAKIPEPTFTFAHIVCPHPPFVFGEHGEDVSPYGKMYRLTDGDQFREFYGDRNEYIDGYRKQAAFITGQVERMIDRLLAESPEPPIIILQSDHGSGLGLDTSSVDRSDLQERMSILNAYYLPDGGEAAIYETITPVNSFRIVLNKYFGAHLALLEDKSFYSTWAEPLKFVDVTERLARESREVPR
jgi:hypothetical protein